MVAATQTQNTNSPATAAAANPSGRHRGSATSETASSASFVERWVLDWLGLPGGKAGAWAEGVSNYGVRAGIPTMAIILVATDSRVEMVPPTGNFKVWEVAGREAATWLSTSYNAPEPSLTHLVRGTASRYLGQLGNCQRVFLWHSDGRAYTQFDVYVGDPGVAAMEKMRSYSGRLFAENWQRIEVQAVADGKPTGQPAPLLHTYSVEILDANDDSLGTIDFYARSAYDAAEEAAYLLSRRLTASEVRDWLVVSGRSEYQLPADFAPHFARQNTSALAPLATTPLTDRHNRVREGISRAVIDQWQQTAGGQRLPQPDASRQISGIRKTLGEKLKGLSERILGHR